MWAPRRTKIIKFKSNVAGMLMLERSFRPWRVSYLYGSPVLVKWRCRKENSPAGFIWNNHHNTLGLPNYMQNVLQCLLLQTWRMSLLMLRDAVRSTARTTCPGRCFLTHLGGCNHSACTSTDLATASWVHFLWMQDPSHPID